MINTLTPQKIKAIEEGLTHYFPFEAGEASRTVFMNDTWSDLNGEYKWTGRDDYFTTLSEATGIQNLKEIKKAAFILEELKSNTSETTTQMPEYKEQTSTVSQGLDEKIEYAKQREEDIRETRKNAETEVERARVRTEAIIKEQQKIQAEIAKSKLAQPKLDNTKIYANITVPEPPFLDEKEQADFETLRNYAENNKEELIEDLAQEIEVKLSKGKNEIAAEQIKLLARDQAEIIVEKIQNIEVVQKELPKIVQLAILDSVITDTTILPTVVNTNESLEAVIHSSKILYNEASKELFSQEITENILGKKFKLLISGPGVEDVSVTFSTIQSENSVPVSLGHINSDATAVQERQNQIISEAKNITVSEASKYVYSNTSTFVESKIASLPTGSKLKSVYSNPAVRGILSKYGMANPVEWKAYSKFGTIQQIKWAGPPYTYGFAVGKKVAFGAGKKVVEQTAVKTGLLATAGSLLAKGAAAIGVSLGVFTLGLSTAVTAVFYAVGKMINWPKVKQWLRENKGVLVGIATGGALALGGPAVGGIVLLGGLVATGLVASFATGAMGAFGFIGRSIGIAIATPVIITILVIPPLVAFIMLVINNSAYVVPPSSLSSSTGADNPYILVTKTANPSISPNPTNSKTTIAYTVEIRALKSTLTNVRLVSSECNVIKNNNAKINCPPEEIPAFPQDLSISPTSPYSFTFFGNYDSGYNDALVYDSITIAADTVEQTNIVTEGSASVCFGDCPQNCAKVSNNADSWPSGLGQNVTIALGNISKYQGFTAKLCPKNETVNLCYRPSKIGEGFYAWHVHNSYGDNCDVYFNSKGVGSSSDASFIVTHELTHHIQSIKGIETIKYIASGGFYELAGNGFCTYSATKGSSTEAMAEAAALYVNSTPSWSACAGNYSSKYPKNFNWAQKFMTQ